MAHPQPTTQRSPATRGVPQQFRLTSPGFADGATIPRQYTADGDNSSPPLTWQSPPEGTQSFALICEDPDAPSGTFIHWLAWDIPADTSELLPRLASASRDVRQGKNGFGNTGYGGPRPPPGKPHRYVFRLYALDTVPDLESGASRNDVEDALTGHVLAEARLTGKYGR